MQIGMVTVTQDGYFNLLTKLQEKVPSFTWDETVSYIIQNRGVTPVILCERETEPIDDREGLMLGVNKTAVYKPENGSTCWIFALEGYTMINVSEA